MDSPTFLALALACAPQVAPSTAHALAAAESALHPWAIGVVGGRLQRQPRTRAEALATARALRAAGWNFSVGLGQINIGNFERLGLTLSSAFEPCINLAAMQAVLTECLDRVPASRASDTDMTSQADQTSLRKTPSCYYSGNFVTGFEHGYVRRVVAAAGTPASARAALPQPLLHPIAQAKEQP
ncbi:lytic transglycosylase domain-containing protein [Paucibacter sp. XJ19-41]|uniref:lytic transglycosylase domain-containing protein n=1 Tax=Paucibacter sp. XJ19-41 TaxID=2927824 RepID=UPI00234AA668|nr:lytic transglycosylase domain-containing protein [Paucibacter sp. XJ19-41]MDC6166582.1 lytic transglycosylase domain-containing protein [Paucibacter sp. XJ19-41]